VTGANRGLGRETARTLAARGWTVLVTARTAEKAAAADALARETGATVHPLPLELRDPESARAAGAAAAELVPHLDALVHNAGAIFDDAADSGIARADAGMLLASIDNNALCALRLTQAVLPLLRAAPDGANVVHVSSGMGALTDMGGGYAGYRLSKAAMNTITRILHAEHGHEGLRVNSVCPGWVQTDMGGAGATRTVEEGTAGIVWAATLEAGGPAGGFFRDGQAIDW
jgi:NAD(P)-dependent dehydrogenase (short-subunit alcohol dehydrogenase family)